ncbi:MAG: twin-arginine translocase TatA/TatE family subunit [Deltaproteobacteria bacterium]|nr:twin-arginine translocase TatA/TatE family subunit [Deltaproteobacteria bacterium]
MPGFTELFLILAIVLVVFGARRVPEIFEALGRGVRSFKRAVHEDEQIDVTPGDQAKLDNKGEGAKPAETVQVKEKTVDASNDASQAKTDKKED